MILGGMILLLVILFTPYIPTSSMIIGIAIGIICLVMDDS